MADVVRLLLEDQEHRERESEERMWLMQQQMEVLQWLVVDTGGRERPAYDRINIEKQKLTKMIENNDVDAYLTTFERLMTVFGAYGNSPEGICGYGGCL